MPNRVGSVLHPSVIFKNPLGKKKTTAQHKRSLHKDSFFFFIFPLSPALSMPVHVKHCKLKEQIFFFSFGKPWKALCSCFVVHFLRYRAVGNLRFWGTYCTPAAALLETSWGIWQVVSDCNQRLLFCMPVREFYYQWSSDSYLVFWILRNWASKRYQFTSFLFNPRKKAYLHNVSHVLQSFVIKHIHNIWRKNLHQVKRFSISSIVFGGDTRYVLCNYCLVWLSYKCSHQKWNHFMVFAHSLLFPPEHALGRWNWFAWPIRLDMCETWQHFLAADRVHHKVLSEHI